MPPLPPGYEPNPRAVRVVFAIWGSIFSLLFIGELLRRLSGGFDPTRILP